jgi:DNA-binding CsgD family transcriptional regulator
VDIELARLTYLDALIAALFAGRLAKPEADLRAVAAAVAALPAPRSSSVVDLLLEGLATSYTVDYRAGLPLLRRALADFGDLLPTTQALRWLSLAYAAAVHIWDDERSQLLSSQWVALVRDVGALSELPLALTGPIMVLVFKGELAKAASVAEELEAATDATQCYVFPHGPVTLAAYRGDRSKTTELIGDAIATATVRGEGYVISSAEWASAVLNNGLGRYAEALAAAQHASQDVWEPGFSNWALVELIEAATHNGSPELGRDAFSRLADMTSAAGTDWALGIEARSHALLAKGSDAEEFYRTAIELLGRTSVRAEHARAYLLYGEWLNRQNRRTDARDQLRTAYEMLSTMGMEGFAERARSELTATGEKVPKRRDDTRVELTPQEYHIATLARAGRTNAEIGTEMFISSRTVEFHLKKVFTKLGISSRRALHDAMDAGNG